MLLMIDNYDSFTYNLVQYFAELNADIVMHRNDEITVQQIAAMHHDIRAQLGKVLHQVVGEGVVVINH